MTVKPSISLTDEQHEFARQLVASGKFGSISAVLQHGLELVRETVMDEEMEREALRRVLLPRLEGEFVSGEEMDRRIFAMIDRKRREHGL